MEQFRDNLAQVRANQVEAAGDGLVSYQKKAEIARQRIAFAQQNQRCAGQRGESIRQRLENLQQRKHIADS
ncbi:MAG: hypothetical protein BRC48_01000 [Cyanobacteria bacterium QS_9_48_30]|nr:MAG: hypothetical protein BRC45_16035 [Cyanobacteria bacterium QS_5_48_63]PSO87823.1 MAG: hypothetical protein BRC43_08290 [Cyanobacteria bacterium QS_3_48_167]PSO98909.1 MAG: hypothetical protein BRC48_01000 [Cyanobacteria bacterium QS_9_48_30]